MSNADIAVDLRCVFSVRPSLFPHGSPLSLSPTREFSNDGIMLSGGEEQKLGLARLFVGDFGLFILDGPSSALDPPAEYERNPIIFDRRNATTTILISHRLSTVRDADRIYLIGDDCVKEYGTHAALMRLDGKYAEMFRKQAEAYVTAESSSA